MTLGLAAGLQVGSDCPDHAVYVDVASSIDRSTTGTQAGALCIFEDDRSETAWRHTNTGGGSSIAQHFSGSPQVLSMLHQSIGTVRVCRWISE